MTTLEIIKELCKQNGTSIKSLEKRLGFSNGSLAKSATIKAERLQKVADYFNVSVDYLISGEENKTPIFEYSSDIMELIKLYSQLNKEQKSAILNMMRSFALNNQ